MPQNLYSQKLVSASFVNDFWLNNFLMSCTRILYGRFSFAVGKYEEITAAPHENFQH